MTTLDAGLPRRPFPVGPRLRLLLAFAAAAAACYWYLGLSWRELLPATGAGTHFRDFFAGAVRPAVDYEASWVPEGAPPFLATVAKAMWETLSLAAASMSLALVAALPLSFLTSESAWGRLTHGVASASSSRHTARVTSRLARAVRPVFRVGIAAMRSTHELLWAVVLLAIFGDHDFLAVLAIAIPYAGTLAKVFSEMIDEAPGDSADALRQAGARPLAVFLFGRLPRAAPDMTAYSFYRFECAVRSSAVMGFFGFPTIGYYLSLSYENLHYREVWTWLYALVALVLVFEAWSARMRRRWVAR